VRTFKHASSESMQVGEIELIRWEQFGVDALLPFQAMWYSVPPGESSPADRHPEVELSLVVSGCAHVESDGRVVRVAQGEAFLLDSDEAHVVHNASAQPLRIFSAYWLMDQVRRG
jgi:mannose-6-phosphate isomerase-like protein (cupin superfamily)